MVHAGLNYSYSYSYEYSYSYDVPAGNNTPSYDPSLRCSNILSLMLGLCDQFNKFLVSGENTGANDGHVDDGPADDEHAADGHAADGAGDAHAAQMRALLGACVPFVLGGLFLFYMLVCNFGICRPAWAERRRRRRISTTSFAAQPNTEAVCGGEEAAPHPGGERRGDGREGIELLRVDVDVRTAGGSSSAAGLPDVSGEGGGGAAGSSMSEGRECEERRCPPQLLSGEQDEEGESTSSDEERDRSVGRVGRIRRVPRDAVYVKHYY